MYSFIQAQIQKSHDLIALILQDEALLAMAETIAKTWIASIERGGKILFVGNGGSAADAQHLAAELVVRLSYNRPGIASLALTTDTSALTAIGNDFSYEHIFSRQVEAVGVKGDVLVGISTSGRSANILKAFEAARARGITTVGFTGKVAPLMAQHCDLVLNIPSDDTGKIQECQMMFGHIICALVEEKLFGEQFNPARQIQTAEIA